jgi:uncharacterized protein (DUF488 family)
MEKLCYSVDYVNRSLTEFINLLKKFQINCIIDIREKNYNLEKVYFSFERENIKKSLNTIGIYYIDMNKEFSLKCGKYSFEDIVSSDDYKMGIERIIAGINKGYKIALICEQNTEAISSKSDFIAYGLKKKNVLLEHIIDEENVKSQREIEEALLGLYKIKLIKKVAELSIKNIMKDIDLEMDESDFKAEMVEEIYKINYSKLIAELLDSVLCLETTSLPEAKDT